MTMYYKLCISLFLLASGCLFGQQNCRNVPMQEVKIIKAQKVKQNGKTVQKKDIIRIYKEIPSQPNQHFFKCNGLVFEKGGELIFRAKGSDSRLLTYNDFIQKSGPGKSNSSNLLSRGQNTDCKVNETPYDYLLDDFVVLKNDECLYAFFGWDTFWLKEDLAIKFTDSSVLPNALVFKDSNGKSYSFAIQGNDLTIKSSELPEEELFDIYLNFEGAEEKVADGIRLINIQKTIERLKNKHYSEEDILNILMQNYFSDACSENDLRKNTLSEIISNSISNPVYR